VLAPRVLRAYPLGNDNPLALQLGLMTVSHVGLLGAFVTERHRSQEQLFHNAHHDSLTGLCATAWLMYQIRASRDAAR